MTIRTDRPRLLVTPASLADLKARAVPTNDRWTSLKAICDRTPASWDCGIPNYSLAYLITGDTAYSTRAWQLMVQSMSAGVAQASNPGHKPTMGPPTFALPTGIHEVDGDSGYQARNFFPAASLLFDWCYPALNATQRAQLRADIEACSDWVFPRTNPSRAGAWGVDNPGNNYHAGFMTTWMAGLALYGDSAKAQGYVDEASRRWSAMVTPYLQGPATGGLWNEGTNYGTASTGFYLYSLLAHQTATGEDLIGTNPWFRDMVAAMLQLTNPPMTEVAPFGDLGAGPVNDNHRRAMLMMASRDPRAQIWLDQVTPDRCLQRVNAYLEYLFYPGTPLVPTKETAG